MGIEWDWRSVDLRPAPAGWRALFVEKDGTLSVVPLAGWLIQEQALVDTDDDFRLVPDQRHAPADRPRRIRPAVLRADLGPEPVEVWDEEFDHTYWTLRGPGEPDPTADEVAERHRDRQP